MQTYDPEAARRAMLAAAVKTRTEEKSFRGFGVKPSASTVSGVAMQFHGLIWRAIDRLAAANGLTPSGLARQAGLDPTTFNKSKRITRDGKLRWPSTESVSRALAATGSSMTEWVSLVEGGQGDDQARRLPLVPANQPDLLPGADGGTVRAQRHLPFPGLNDPRAFALEIVDASLEPVYYPGDILVVSPTSPARNGDRVMVRMNDGRLVAQQLLRRGPRKVELMPLHPRHAEVALPADEIAWIARILWASQGRPEGISG